MRFLVAVRAAIADDQQSVVHVGGMAQGRRAGRSCGDRSKDCLPLLVLLLCCSRRDGWALKAGSVYTEPRDRLDLRFARDRPMVALSPRDRPIWPCHIRIDRASAYSLSQSRT